LDKQEKLELAELIAGAVVKALESKGMFGTPKPKSEKTAYQKTEQLLFNYLGFKRIVEERKQEIIDLRTHGVPGKSGSIVAYSPKSGTVHGTVLPEESVEAAVRTVEASVHDTVQVIALIDKCMAALKGDPYYEILEMRYFEGRTLEDIGVYFGCDHSTISRNRSRLVKELSMRLFPDEVANEMMK
jgi:hypothetical protein